MVPNVASLSTERYEVHSTEEVNLYQWETHKGYVCISTSRLTKGYRQDKFTSLATAVRVWHTTLAPSRKYPPNKQRPERNHGSTVNNQTQIPLELRVYQVCSVQTSALVIGRNPLSSPLLLSCDHAGPQFQKPTQSSSTLSFNPLRIAPTVLGCKLFGSTAVRNHFCSIKMIIKP